MIFFFSPSLRAVGFRVLGFKFMLKICINEVSAYGIESIDSYLHV